MKHTVLNGVNERFKTNKTIKHIYQNASESKKHPSRLERAIEYLEQRFEFRLNILSNRIEYRDKDTSESSEFRLLNPSDLYIHLDERNIPLNDKQITAYLTSSRIERFHPIKDYLDRLEPFNPNSETDYIESLCKFVQTDNDERFHKHFRKMLLRCIECAIEPDYFNKHAFILVQEEQNGGKSSFLRWLCPEKLKPYYTEHFSPDKDGLIALTENIFINLDELSSLQRFEVNQLKSKISQQYIKIRRPYGRVAESSARIASFIGSTNKTDFLNDETGNVRWLIFKVYKIDFEYSIQIKVDDLYRQAYFLFKQGERGHLTQSDIEENTANNRDYSEQSPEYEYIARNLEPGDETSEFSTASEIVAKASKAGIRLNAERVGKAMKQLGFKQKSKYISNLHSVKGYYVHFLNPDHSN